MNFIRISAAAAALVFAGSASANIIQSFFGGAPGTNPVSFDDTNYEAAKESFLASVPGAQVGVESFENWAPDTFLGLGAANPNPLSFGTSFDVTGSLVVTPPPSGFPDGDSGASLAPQIANGDPEGQTLPNGRDARIATEGSNFLFVGVDAEPATFAIEFDPDNVVRGFGFSITDLGDFGAQIVVDFFDGPGQTFEINSSTPGLSSDDFDNGDHIWAGFTADANIASVSILLDPGTSRDAFSFDEFTVLVVPVPPAVGIAGLGLVVAVAGRRRLLASCGGGTA